MGNEIVNRCPNCGDQIDVPGFCSTKCMREFHNDGPIEAILSCEFCFDEYAESISMAKEQNRFCCPECEKRYKEDD